MHKVELIGGPHDGEIVDIEVGGPEGAAIRVPEGRYVVLGSPSFGAGAWWGVAFFEELPTPARPAVLDDDTPIGRAALGLIGGLMWGCVIFAGLGIWALGGWLINELAYRVGFTNLTIGLLAGGAITGAIAGYFDAKSNR